MRKIGLLAIAAVLIVATVGVLAAATAYAPVPARSGAMIDPLQLMANTKDLPAFELIDRTFVFPEQFE